MRIKSVCFDLDGTLYDFRKVMQHSLKIALAEIIRRIPECRELLSVDKMIEIRNLTAQELKGIVFNLEEIRLISFKKTLNYCGVDDDEFAEQLNQLYLKHRFEDVELFDDVVPTLEGLKQRYILGILSNGNSYPETLGVERYFQFVILAQEVGVEKPDPGIFHLAMEKAGCQPEEFLYVGDSQGDDIVGSRRAGVKIAWFNRTNAQLRPNVPRPDYEIENLSMLLKILNV
ncbi:HAD family hydrolase [Candidatus Poribacteria bacterium]